MIKIIFAKIDAVLGSKIAQLIFTILLWLLHPLLCIKEADEVINLYQKYGVGVALFILVIALFTTNFFLKTQRKLLLN